MPYFLILLNYLYLSVRFFSPFFLMLNSSYVQFAGMEYEYLLLIEEKFLNENEAAHNNVDKTEAL